MNNVWIALGLTVFAGMATGIGSAMAFMAKRTNYRFISVATRFSAGVMVYVSFVEIFFKGEEFEAIETLSKDWNSTTLDVLRGPDDPRCAIIMGRPRCDQA